MEGNGNNGIFGVDRKQMRAANGKQEIYLKWPKLISICPYVQYKLASYSVSWPQSYISSLSRLSVFLGHATFLHLRCFCLP